MHSETPELQVVRQAARAGGDVVTRFRREGFSSSAKAPSATYNLVSDADLESERAIVEVIRAAFPDHAILGEEFHHDDSGAGPLWVIDPLDGTTNFVHNIPHFAVSVAYYESERPVCGVVYNPARDDWYEAIHGQGAFHNGTRVSVNHHSRLDQVLIATGFYYDRGAMMEATLAAIHDLFKQNIHGIRRFGTASLDLAMVGTGVLGAFFEYNLAPWDFAAGRLFVEEAGGRVTTCGGSPLPVKETSVLATNGRLHDAVAAIVGEHLPGGGAAS